MPVAPGNSTAGFGHHDQYRRGKEVSAADNAQNQTQRKTDPTDKFGNPIRHRGSAGGRGDIEYESDGDENASGDRQIKRLHRMLRCFIDTCFFGDFRHRGREQKIKRVVSFHTNSLFI